MVFLVSEVHPFDDGNGGVARVMMNAEPASGASGQLIGIEVKAAATVTASDARHLAWLRDQTGDAFAAGIVLHTGPYVFPVSDRIVAAPVSTLW